MSGEQKHTENRRRAGFTAAKAVGAYVPAVTKTAFEKFGFAAATLITDWDQIVGPDVAAATLPERLKWPRLPKTAEVTTERPAATLVLRVDPARAFDIEYQSRQILERINTYFGYRAVGAVKLVQAPIPERRSQTSRRAAAAVSAAPTGPVAHAERTPEADGLQLALSRMEAGVRRKNVAAKKAD